jgi:DNA polymerase delta subunit 1
MFQNKNSCLEESIYFQAYKWEVIETDENINIYIYGLDQQDKKVAVHIPDFKPYIYLELDKTIKWNNNNIELVKNCLKTKLNESFPVKCKLVNKKKNYYYQEAQFLWCAFSRMKDIEKLDYLTKNGKTTKKIYVNGIGNIKLTPHEQKAGPILQLQAMRKVKPSGWIKATKTSKKGLIEEFTENFSKCDINILSSFSDISPAEGITHVTNPTIICYDIECVSADIEGNTFPNPNLPTDQAICITATVCRLKDDEKDWKTFTLVNEYKDRICPDDIPDCFQVKHYKNERDMLLGWRDFINEINPDVIIGYNTLSFDDNYIAIRSQVKNCWEQFCIMGKLLNQKCTTDQRKWSSSAYGDQEFKYLNIHGVLHIDMLPVIFKNNSNLMSYTLDYVSEYFLDEHKIDLPPKEIIKKWHRGLSTDIRDIVIYGNKDSILPLKLFKKLNTWLDLNEMSNVVMVQMFDLITRGQQIRVYSQVYTLTFDLNVVCTEKWADYNPTDEEKEYVGATVQNPQCGYWEMVATYDFKSLYPTTIIAYNLCFSTFIPEGENPEPETFHDLSWSEHVGCEHDTAIRKTKITKHICRNHHYRFYKAEIKKGIIPMLLENLLEARSNTRKEIYKLEQKLKQGGLSVEEEKNLKLQLIVLDKRQNGYKVSANSAYGGFGSDFSYTPFYPAAASTTAMGRKSIQDAIDFAKKYRSDTFLVYGDTDSCMIRFEKITKLKEAFKVCEDMEKAINEIFPKPMYLELEKIYSKYFLLSKKRYVGYIVDKEGTIKSVDKKGIVLKRRDNCGYLKEIYSMLIDMIMAKEPRWKLYEYIAVKIDDLLSGNVDLEKLVITKSIKENYKAQNLPHVAVSKKMLTRGKYVTAGTRIKYIFVKTENPKDPQYIKAEDPDYYLENKDTLKIDYMYYFEKQLITPIDEIFQVKYNKSNVLKNLHKLMKKKLITKATDYFYPKFEITG